MAAMFSQNPLMNGPNYSFNQTPTTAQAGNKEHAFYP
jgi:20S proteasome subunit beta 6